MPSNKHHHDYFEMELYLSGGGNVGVNNSKYPIKRGICSFAIPANIHSIELTEDAEIFHLSFSEKAISDPAIFNAVCSLAKPCVCFNEEEIEYLMVIFNKMCRCIQENNVYERAYISRLIECIVLEYMTRSDDCNVQKQENIKLPNAILKAINYINLNFMSEISQDDVAKHCGISKNHFSGMFHKYMGVSYKNYIMDKKLEYAARLILSDELSVTEIAYMVGYNNVSSFQRSFKAKYNVSPKKYADLINKK